MRQKYRCLDVILLLGWLILAACQASESTGQIGGSTTITPPTVTVANPPADVAAEPSTPLIDTADLRKAVTVEGVRRHLEHFQAIAVENDGRRTSGTAGYDASAAYVAKQLEAAGYTVTRQEFEFPYFEDASRLAVLAPEPMEYHVFWDFATMAFSADGQVSAPLQAVDVTLPATATADSGCQDADFATFEAGNIALLMRGVCPFAEKAENAVAAGASAVLVFNDGLEADREGVVRGTLGEPGIPIPVVGLSLAAGEALYRQTLAGEVVVDLSVAVISEDRTTSNIIADTPGGRDDTIIVVGGHLDSVPLGPGIQDNGSGTAVILETALQMAKLGIEPRNKVRFAFWGAEEFGLLGSQHYVDSLSRSELGRIALNLNFDMVASPNYVRFVYDGDRTTPLPRGMDLRIPSGSDEVETVFREYFAGQGLAVAETPFDGRSDYGPFVRAGIPAGGLFSGAEGVKTADEAAVYGGTAGAEYDACYHLPCDTIDNVNWQAVDEMGDAAAHAILTFAQAEGLFDR